MLPYLIHWFGSFDLASSNQIYNFLKIFLEQIDRIKLIKKIKKIFLTTRSHHFTNSFNYWFCTQSYGFYYLKQFWGNAWNTTITILSHINYETTQRYYWKLWIHLNILIWEKNGIEMKTLRRTKSLFTEVTVPYCKFDQFGTQTV